MMVLLVCRHRHVRPNRDSDRISRAWVLLQVAHESEAQACSARFLLQVTFNFEVTVIAVFKFKFVFEAR